MAVCRMTGKGVYVFDFADGEMATVRIHADRETLTLAEALVDLVECVLVEKRLEFCAEEKGDTTCPYYGRDGVKLAVHWPKSGPYSVLDSADTKFVMSVLSMSLREALCVVLYKRGFEGHKDVMERGNEEDGTGKPDVFVI